MFLLSDLSIGSEKFNPIATIDTNTIGKNKFSLSRAPLGNLNSSFLASSLNFGLFDRVEIGTAPIFYALPTHRYNYNIKVHVYDGDITDWSLTAGSMTFQTEILVDGEIEKPDVDMSIIHLATNINIPDSPYKIGLSAARSCGMILSDDALTRIFSIKCEDETGFDFQYEFRDNWWLTLGQGRNRESGMTPWESIVNGYGAAVTMFKPKAFISRPSVGYYVSENGENMFLFTTTFYEE